MEIYIEHNDFNLTYDGFRVIDEECFPYKNFSVLQFEEMKQSDFWVSVWPISPLVDTSNQCYTRNRFKGAVITAISMEIIIILTGCATKVNKGEDGSIVKGIIYDKDNKQLN